MTSGGSDASAVVNEWHTQAACVGMDPTPWFPEQGNHSGSQWAAARAICHRCPVRLHCLDEALTTEQGLSGYYRSGMFGGLTPAERAQIRKRAQR